MYKKKYRCSICGLFKTAFAFSPQKERKDGLTSSCKQCRNEIVIKKYHADPEPPKERARKYRAKNLEKVRAADRRRKRATPEKVKARAKVSNEIKRNRLIPEPCEVCGATPAEAHHDDYSKPLVIRWLCRKHHRIAHRKYEVQNVQEAL